MKIVDLLAIAHFVYEKSQLLIPFSSNKPHFNNIPLHKSLLMSAMRSFDPKRDRHKLRAWRFNLAEDTLPASLGQRCVRESFFAAPSNTPTLNEWEEHIKNLPLQYLKKVRKNGEPISTIERFESSAKNAINFGIGNCGENATLTFLLLLEYPLTGLPESELPRIEEKIFIERIIISGGDHAFVVMGRDPNSNLNDVSTWGNSAIIIDPWMNAVVVVTQALHHYKSHCLEYILHYEKNLQRGSEQFAHVGDGHSDRWIKRCLAKNETVHFRDWKPAFEEGEIIEEQIPWVEDTDEEKHVSKKRRL